MNILQPSTPTGRPEASGPRSEGLLPADNADPNLDVAEEVSLDLQSDSARRVGALPPAAEKALADTLVPGADETPLRQAIERAVPPSA